MTEFDKWLDENFSKRSKEVPIPSHLRFDGGKVFVPRNREYEFLCRYAEEYSKGTKLYFVETRPKTFKYMIDIDITDDHYWEISEIKDLVAKIQKIVYEFFDMPNVTICCSSPPKIKKDGTHTGIHLIWPSLFVTSDSALIIRRGIIQQLKNFPKKMNKSWEDTLDEVIYTRNGYRMVGSDKMTPPPEKVPENRSLELLFVMNSDQELSSVYYERLKQSPKSLMTETSIRYVLDTYSEKGMDIKYPTWLEEDAMHIKSGSKIPGTIVSGLEHTIVENFIRKFLPKVYHGTVKAVTRYPDKNLLIKTNSRFCMNLGRSHNSCGIYFFASPRGLVQRCLCPCEKLESRKHGYCRDYISECYPFDEQTLTQLFPEHDKIMFAKEKKNTKVNKFVPAYKVNKELEARKECDKLLNDILS